jgi:membrane protease YdiL (CAAX protease family)
VPEALLQCPACRRGLRSGTQFCPGCGHSLVAGDAGSDPWRGAAADQHRQGSDPDLRAVSRFSRRRFIEHWEELKRIAWLFGLLLASSFVFGIAFRSSPSPWLDVMEGGTDALIVLVAVARRWRKLVFLFQPRPTTLGGAALMIAIAVVFVVLASAYFWLIERLGVPVAAVSGTLAEAGWPLWAMLLLISVMPAIFEELAFRGVIQSSLERVFNARDAWLIQAALFSVLHLSPLIFPSHFLMGLCFGYMRRRSRSIYPGMLLHGSWNALVLLEELPG